MTRGQLPKAYLRIDPNIHQTHPDNLADFVRLLCAANRQPRRGWFRSRAVLVSLLGRTAAGRLFDRGDVAETEDGVRVPGWETWQEGDLTVGERVGRYRALHAVTKPLPSRYPASEAVRQLGSKALDVLTDAPPARDNEPEFPIIQWLILRGCHVRAGNGYHQALITAVEVHGAAPLITAMERLERAGTARGDTKGYVFGAIDLVKPKPDLRKLGAEDREAEERRSLEARQAATRARIAELQS